MAAFGFIFSRHLNEAEAEAEAARASGVTIKQHSRRDYPAMLQGDQEPKLRLDSPPTDGTYL